MNKKVFEMLQSLATGTPWRGIILSSVEREDGSGLCWNITGTNSKGIVKFFVRFPCSAASR